MNPRPHPQRRGRIPLDPDAFIFMIPLAAIGALGWAFAVAWVWIPALLALAAVAVFFRDPPRRGSRIPGAFLSPADGRVVAIEPNEDPLRGPAPGMRITIFLSVLDCHVNRSPCAGTVQRIRYQRGEFRSALKTASSEANESAWIFLQTGQCDVTVRQIAGALARRIVTRVREGQVLRRGQRIGLIRFGSRTELCVPARAEIRAVEGQRVRAGESVLAILRE